MDNRVLCFYAVARNVGSDRSIAQVILVILTLFHRFITPCYLIFFTIFFKELVSCATIFGQLEVRYFHYFPHLGF